MNENQKTILILAIALAAVVLISVIGFILLIKIQTTAKRRKIESYGRKSEQQIDALLKKAFGDDAVFSGIYIPYLKSEEKKHAEIDHLVVTRSGICVIEVKSHNGSIRCPDERYWWQTYNDKKISFYNPLRQNKMHTKIVGELLRNEGQYNVPIYSVVVFTSCRVTFTHKYDNVIRTEKLVDYIKKNGKKNAISTSQTRRVRDIIKHSSTKDRSVARRHKSSIRGFKKNPGGRRR